MNQIEFAKRVFRKTKQLDTRLKNANIKLVFSNRMTRSAGTAKSSFKMIDGKDVAFNLVVTLSNRWLQLHNEDEIADTIKHELAHILNYIVYGRNQDGHGRNWKRFAVKLGAKPQRCFSTKNVDFSKAKKLKYSAMCPKHGEIKQISRKWKQRLFPDVFEHQQYIEKHGIYGKCCAKCKQPLTLKQNY